MDIVTTATLRRLLDALAATPPGEEPTCGPAGCVLPAAHRHGCKHARTGRYAADGGAR